MPYPPIKGRLIRTGKEHMVIEVALVDDTPNAQEAARRGCEMCPFHKKNELLFPTQSTLVRCTGVNGVMDIDGRGGTNVGRKIAADASCGVNPTEVRRVHFGRR